MTPTSTCRIHFQETIARAVGLRLRERPREYFFLQNLFFLESRENSPVEPGTEGAPGSRQIKTDAVHAARIHLLRFLLITPPSQGIPLGVSCREVCGNIPAGRQL